jgi:hypothetical protein
MIDKHRRLHLIGTYPDDIYSATPAGVTVGWRWTRGPWVDGSGPWVDGSEIGRWLLPEGHEETTIWPHASVILILQEHLDLGWTNVDVIEFLESLVNQVEWRVVPSVAAAM